MSMFAQKTRKLRQDDADFDASLRRGDAMQASTRAFARGTPEAGSSSDRGGIPRFVQARVALKPKLTLAAPGDAYEQEADRVADGVMRAPKAVAFEREELVQRKPANRGQAGTELVPAHDMPHSPGQPLDADTRAFMEPRIGHDFSNVRIHADSKSAEMAEALNARAFTLGNDIFFGRQELRPRTTESKRLLAHELVHVAQQSRMGPALQPKLRITGKPDDVARAVNLLNTGLSLYQVTADKSGTISIARTVTGPATTQEQALVDHLTTVISDPKDVIMTVSAGSKTLVGSYAQGDFDISDVEALGVGALIHEIVEQYQKQVKSQPFGTTTTGAHGEATKAESEVRGAIRGADKVISMTQNADGTIDAVIETPFTYPNNTVKTMVATIKSNNIVSVTWK